MTTVTGLTADRMLAIEAASVIDGDVDGNGNLILTKHDGSQINAGSVIGPTGPQGPVGSMLPVVSAKSVLDIGLVNQIRAGRQLSPADFAAIGLNAPLGLWNLSDLSDASGNGRALSNKGAVPFVSGINGGANTAAQFSGSTAQGLYISDTGAADPFRIKTGSFGCWFRTAKRNSSQAIVGKYGVTVALADYLLLTNANNTLDIDLGNGTSALGFTSPIDVCDDRWHFVVATFDGIMLRSYLDGVSDINATFNGPLNSNSTAPVNIGGYSGDASTAIASPMYGRVDEAFISADVLSEDQVRMLYCAKIGHTLAAIPSRVSLNVRRRKRGAALASADFPTQPLRLHNFSAGSLGDEGSNNLALTNNGGAINIGGSDGSSGNAFIFNGLNSLYSADTGLPVGVSSKSVGCWMKTVAVNPSYYLTYGSASTPFGLGMQTGGVLITTDGASNFTGPFIADGQWHFIVMIADNGALDGTKEKVYIDGRCIGGLASFPAMVLGGANCFRVGCLSNATVAGTSPFTGQVDGAFLCDYALTSDQIRMLYAKGAQVLSPSPKNVGDHVEGMDAANLYATFDTLDTQHQVDLAVA
jgi:hypothetical protein